MEKRSSEITRQGDVAYFGYRQVSTAEKNQLVQDHFNTVAARYDFVNTLLSFGSQHMWKRTAVQMLGLREGERVIDVCGGTADLTLLAAKAVGRMGRVVLYDFNWPMVKIGRHKVAHSSFNKTVDIILGDAEYFSVADECFDVAMVGFGIRNLTRMERGFQEMHRVLKRGGRIMCLEFAQPVTPWFRYLYDFYSFYIMPFVGKLFVGSREAYTYLPESIRMFSAPEELSNLLETIGFSRVTYRLLTDGIAVIHVGVKE